jgi:hypothetical protein
MRLLPVAAEVRLRPLSGAHEGSQGQRGGLGYLHLYRENRWRRPTRRDRSRVPGQGHHQGANKLLRERRGTPREADRSRFRRCIRLPHLRVRVATKLDRVVRRRQERAQGHPDHGPVAKPSRQDRRLHLGDQSLGMGRRVHVSRADRNRVRLHQLHAALAASGSA